MRRGAFDTFLTNCLLHLLEGGTHEEGDADVTAFNAVANEGTNGQKQALGETRGGSGPRGNQGFLGIQETPDAEA